MIRTALRGLRGRLLLSLVATSAITLAVAAAITLGPLQSRLRNESRTALVNAAEDLRGDFTTELAKDQVKTSNKPDPAYEDKVAQSRTDRSNNVYRPAYDLRNRSGGARVLVADLSFTDKYGESPGFLYDTDFVSNDRGALRVALQSVRENSPETLF